MTTSYQKLKRRYVLEMYLDVRSLRLISLLCNCNLTQSSVRPPVSYICMYYNTFGTCHSFPSERSELRLQSIDPIKKGELLNFVPTKKGGILNFDSIKRGEF